MEIWQSRVCTSTCVVVCKSMCILYIVIQQERKAYSAIYDRWECQIVKNICTIPPCISISILSLALIIKTIYLAVMELCIKYTRSVMLAAKFQKVFQLIFRNISNSDLCFCLKIATIEIDSWETVEVKPIIKSTIFNIQK